MLPGSWTAHLVNCNTASITDEDFAWAELRAECVATGRHAAEYPKVQTENDDRPANITLTRARKVTFAIDGYEPTPRQTIRHSSS